MEQTATNVINTLKTVFINDRFQFDFTVSQYISGNHNKDLRRGIILQITGEKRPLSRCGMYAVSDVLTAKFQQYELFI